MGRLSTLRRLGHVKGDNKAMTTTELVKYTECLFNGLKSVMIVHPAFTYVLWIHLDKIKINKEVSSIPVLPHAFQIQRPEC